MSWFITQTGRNDIVLFLVDRTKTKKQWWTGRLGLAMKFNNIEAAESQLKLLKYNDPQVVCYEEALAIHHNNIHYQIINEEHPFSSDALGQD